MRHPGINSYALLLLVPPHRTHNVENVRLTGKRLQSSSVFVVVFVVVVVAVE